MIKRYLSGWVVIEYVIKLHYVSIVLCEFIGCPITADDDVPCHVTPPPKYKSYRPIDSDLKIKAARQRAGLDAF